jgi:hypothetical protein
MQKREIVRRIRVAKVHVGAEINGHAAGGGIYSRGLASEGYSGGYRDALEDVLLLLESDTVPNRRHYWVSR